MLGWLYIRKKRGKKLRRKRKDKKNIMKELLVWLWKKSFSKFRRMIEDNEKATSIIIRRKGVLHDKMINKILIIKGTKAIEMWN